MFIFLQCWITFQTTATAAGLNSTFVLVYWMHSLTQQTSLCSVNSLTITKLIVLFYCTGNFVILYPFILPVREKTRWSRIPKISIRLLMEELMMVTWEVLSPAVRACDFQLKNNFIFPHNPSLDLNTLIHRLSILSVPFRIRYSWRLRKIFIYSPFNIFVVCKALSGKSFW